MEPLPEDTKAAAVVVPPGTHLLRLKVKGALVDKLAPLQNVAEAEAVLDLKG
jgi:hypothetical protein